MFKKSPKSTTNFVELKCISKAKNKIKVLVQYRMRRQKNFELLIQFHEILFCVIFLGLEHHIIYIKDFVESHLKGHSGIKMCFVIKSFNFNKITIVFLTFLIV